MSDQITIVIEKQVDIIEVPGGVEVIEVGKNGQPGVGVPPGGTTGQELVKLSDTDFHTGWQDRISPTVFSVFGREGDIIAVGGDYNTGQVTEGVNLYYTQSRFDTAFAAKSTSNLTEGSNLYFTNARADARADLRITAQKGMANGLAPLGANSKIDLAYIPDSIIGGMNYQGTWNASTNSPALVSSVGTKGFYYVVSTPGATNLNGITDWKLGDWAVFNGTAWQKIDNTDAVLSVNAAIGAVVLTASNTGTSLGWVGTELQIPTANSGTLGLLSSSDWNTFNSKASESYVTSQGYITNAALAGLATEMYVNSALANYVANTTYNANLLSFGLSSAAAYSVVGNASSTNANAASITASMDGQVLVRGGGALGFGALDLANSAAISGALPIAHGGVKAGGATGQALVKLSGTDFDIGWGSPAAAGTVPVGCVVGMITGSCMSTPAVASNFVRCDGQVLNDVDSPFDGQTMPDLNGALSGQPAILRGGSTSGGSNGSDSNSGVSLTASCGGANLSVSTTDSFFGSGSVSGSCSASVSVSGSGSMSASYYSGIDTMGGFTSAYLPSDTNVFFTGSGTAFVDFSTASVSVSGSGTGFGSATGSIDSSGTTAPFSNLPFTIAVIWYRRVK